jgi:hypothetical protein
MASDSIAGRARELADKAESILHNMPNGEGFDETHCRIARGQYDIAILVAELADAVQAHLGEGQSTGVPVAPTVDTGTGGIRDTTLYPSSTWHPAFISADRLAILELAQAACVAKKKEIDLYGHDVGEPIEWDAWEAAMREAGL